MLSQLVVKIVRFVDDAQPGWVACEFEDADGRRHTLIDKVPIFTDKMLDSSSTYPQDGAAPCRVLSKWSDARVGELVRLTTDLPAAIESTDGLSEFIVHASQIVAA